MDEFPIESNETGNQQKEDEETNTLFWSPESIKPNAGELKDASPIQHQPIRQEPIEEEEELENQKKSIPRYVKLNHSPN